MNVDEFPFGQGREEFPEEENKFAANGCESTEGRSLGSTRHKS